MWRWGRWGSFRCPQGSVEKLGSGGRGGDEQGLEFGEDGVWPALSPGLEGRERGAERGRTPAGSTCIWSPPSPDGLYHPGSDLLARAGLSRRTALHAPCCCHSRCDLNSGDTHPSALMPPDSPFGPHPCQTLSELLIQEGPDLSPRPCFL